MNTELQEKLIEYIQSNDLKSFDVLWKKSSTHASVDINALLSASLQHDDIWMARNVFKKIGEANTIRHFVSKETFAEILQYGREDLIYFIQRDRKYYHNVSLIEMLDASLQLNDPELFFSYVTDGFKTDGLRSKHSNPPVFGSHIQDVIQKMIEKDDLQVYVRYFSKNKNRDFLNDCAVKIIETNNLEKFQSFARWGGVTSPSHLFCYAYTHVFQDRCFSSSNRQNLLQHALPFMAFLAKQETRSTIWHNVLENNMTKEFYMYYIEATGDVETVQQMIPKVFNKNRDLAADISQCVLSYILNKEKSEVTETRKRKM